jgi:hypothetical protein
MTDANHHNTGPNENPTILRGCASSRDHAIMSDMRGHFVNRQRPAKPATPLTYVQNLPFDWAARGHGRRWRRKQLWGVEER